MHSQQPFAFLLNRYIAILVFNNNHDFFQKPKLNYTPNTQNGLLLPPSALLQRP